MHVRMGTLPATLAAVAVLVIQACSTGSPTPSTSVATVLPVASNLNTTAPAEPTASPAPPADAAPAELQGRWNTVIAPGDQATLILGQTSYQLTRGGDSGGGHISVDGDSITFSDAKLCAGGVGTYKWAIADGVLTFTPVGTPDPCPRKDVLLKPLSR
jgi:hypothetical protein